MAEISKIKKRIDNAIKALNDARHAAESAGNQAAAGTAQAQAEKLLKISNLLQISINENRAADLNALAGVLEQSIRAQVAVSLLGSARELARAVREAIGREISVPAGPGVEGGSGTSDTPEPVGDGDTGGGTSGGTGTTEPTGGGETPAPAGMLVAKPGPHKAVIDAIIAGMAAQEFEPLSTLAIIHVETGGTFDPTAQNKATSAGGLFQFVDGTWLAMGGTKHGPGGKGHGHAAKAPVDEQIRIGCKFSADNIRALAKALGRAPTPGEHYLSHMFGMAGVKKLLFADANTPIEDLFGAETAANNGLTGKTAGQVINEISAKLVDRIGKVRALLEPAAIDETATAPSGDGGPVSEPSAGGGDDGDRPIAMKAINVALAEQSAFGLKDGKVVKETAEPMRSRALEYFAEVGRGDIKDPSKQPWSAAFISHVMRAAGATRDQFRFSAGHFSYIFDALRNTQAGRNDAFLVYADRSLVAPRLGDLVGNSRDDRIKNTADIAARLPADPKKDESASFPSHTDVVIKIGDGVMTVMGGNKGNTIATEQVVLTADGKIDPASKYFFILRVNG